MLWIFFFIQTFQESLPSFLHLDQPAFKSLPEFVVLSAAGIRRMPDVVLDEFFDLVFPGRPKHMLFDAFYRNH